MLTLLGLKCIQFSFSFKKHLFGNESGFDILLYRWSNLRIKSINNLVINKVISHPDDECRSEGNEIKKFVADCFLTCSIPTYAHVRQVRKNYDAFHSNFKVLQTLQVNCVCGMSRITVCVMLTFSPDTFLTVENACN